MNSHTPNKNLKIIYCIICKFEPLVYDAIKSYLINSERPPCGVFQMWVKKGDSAVKHTGKVSTADSTVVEYLFIIFF